MRRYLSIPPEVAIGVAILVTCWVAALVAVLAAMGVKP